MGLVRLVPSHSRLTHGVGTVLASCPSFSCCSCVGYIPRVRGWHARSLWLRCDARAACAPPRSLQGRQQLGRVAAAELHDRPVIAAPTVVETNLEPQPEASSAVSHHPHLSVGESGPPMQPSCRLAGCCWRCSSMDPSAAGICVWGPRGSSSPMAISWLSTRSSLALRPLGAAAVKCVCEVGGEGADRGC